MTSEHLDEMNFWDGIFDGQDLTIIMMCQDLSPKQEELTYQSPLFGQASVNSEKPSEGSLLAMIGA